MRVKMAAHDPAKCRGPAPSKLIIFELKVGTQNIRKKMKNSNTMRELLIEGRVAKIHGLGGAGPTDGCRSTNPCHV